MTPSTQETRSSRRPALTSSPIRPNHSTLRSSLTLTLTRARTVLAAVAALVVSGSLHAAPQDAGPIQTWGSNSAGQVSVPLATKIAAGGSHSLAITSSANAIGWGLDNYGQTALPPNFVPIDIAAGASHTVLLRNNFTVVCVGNNFLGQCDVPANLGIVNKVAAGEAHTIAIKSGGSVVCWGWNGSGQCDVPANLGPVTDADGGIVHSVALRTDGTVVCWGSNFDGQCSVPSNLGTVVQVAAGGYHTVALRSNGTVVCWGENSYGQCNVPANLGSVVQIDAGEYFTVALRADGTAVCWGSNFAGESAVPPNLTGVAEIAAGLYHVVARKTDGTVLGWGNNFYGESNPPASLQASPVVELALGGSHTLVRKQNGSVFGVGLNASGQCNVPGDLGVPLQIDAGGLHSVARRADGTVACWGDNAQGQCTVPPTLGVSLDVAAGGAHTVAVKADGSVVCWGQNTNGQCTVPTNLGPVVQVDAGQSHTIALRADGTVVCWGLNTNGQCNVPANLTGVVQVAAGDFHSVALRSNGTVVCWGLNTSGQCNVPANLGTVLQIAAGGAHTVARRANLTLAMWGSNAAGQTVEQSNLTVANSTGPVAAGGQHSAALKLQSAPLNDECANALVVAEGITPFSTLLATNSSISLPASCNEGNGLAMVKDIWFRFTADATGMATVSTCGQAFYDTRIAAYPDVCGSSTVLACDDDSGGCGGGTSTMSFAVEAGQSYLIAVGGRTGSGSGFLTIDTPEVANPSTFIPIDFSASFNWSLGLQTGGELYPTGNILLGGVLFSIPPSTGLNAWHAKDVLGKNPRVLGVPVNVANVTSVHALINSWWGVPGPGSLATVEFYGCNGAFYSKPLVGNVDIRDHFNGSFTNLINGTTTVEVFGNGQVRMDKVRFDLPAAFLDEKLELIRIVDTGAEAVQRVWLAGLTVEAVESDCPADFSGDGVVGGEDLAILLGGWGPGCAGDLDGDGIVSGADLAVMLGAWGACNP